jgi:hypothetical protein
MNPGATTNTTLPLRCRLQHAAQAQRDLFINLSQRLRRHWLLLVIMGIGLAARMPGVLWGFNYPTGWTIHHIDEYTHLSNAGCLINPSAPQGPGTLYLYGCRSNYPRGLATHVALPHLLLRAAENKLRDPLPAPTTIVVAGRLVSVFYGIATIPLVFLLARLFFRTHPSVPHFSAAFFALGRLHVSQSHFFVADVPVIFWLLLVLHLVGRFIEIGPPARPHYINFAALACGIAIGIKFSVAALPSLAIACVLYPRRLVRLLYAAVFLAAGICVANLDSFSLYQFHRMLQDFTVVGMGGYHFSRIASAGIYLLEIPSIISFPVTMLAAGGVLLFCRRPLANRSRSLRLIVLVFLVPNLIGAWFVFFKADNAPRHLLVFVPWIAIAAGWALSELSATLARQRLKPVWVAAPVFLYLGVFVFDGERVFFEDPRNRAVEWLLANVPKGLR